MPIERPLTPATVEAELREKAQELGITIPENEMLTAPQVADILGKPITWVQYQIKKGSLAAEKYCSPWEISLPALAKHKADNFVRTKH